MSRSQRRSDTACTLQSSKKGAIIHLVKWQTYVPSAAGVSWIREFLESAEARPIRILSEYLEPLRRFKEQKIQDTVVFFGSARVDSRDRAERALQTLQRARRSSADGQYQAELQKILQGGRVGALLRGCARTGPAAHHVEPDAAVRAPPLRRHLRRRSGHHGGGQPRRARGRRQDHRPEHPPAVRAGRPTATSPTACTSSSTTSSCGSSGSPIWRRRSSCFPAGSARSTSCSRS